LGFMIAALLKSMSLIFLIISPLVYISFSLDLFNYLAALLFIKGLDSLLTALTG
jgi:hypothetical protein